MESDGAFGGPLKATKLQVSALDGVARGVRVRGDMDLATLDGLEEALARLPSGPGPIVIDGSEIDFMDSTGLSLLLRLAEPGNGVPALVMRNPSPAVLRLFEIAVPDGVPGLEVQVGDGRTGFEPDGRDGSVEGGRG